VTANCLLAIDNGQAIDAITAARQAADTPDAIDDYRRALIDAMRRRDDGEDAALIMRALYRAAYIAGHLDGAASVRAEHERAEMEDAILTGLAELAAETAPEAVVRRRTRARTAPADRPDTQRTRP
jgi:hypothetical protein